LDIPRSPRQTSRFGKCSCPESDDKRPVLSRDENQAGGVK
jgi:hypothetical protein